jgi:hypothetical protein
MARQLGTVTLPENARRLCHLRMDRLMPTPGGCLEWPTADRNGYGRVTYREGGTRKQVSAHRAAWIAVKGDLDALLVIDHLCHNRLCVNVDHLEPVTEAENIRRGAVVIANRAKYPHRPLRSEIGQRTHCRNGHEWTPENVYARIGKDGYRNVSCRACNRERLARLRAK